MKITDLILFIYLLNLEIGHRIIIIWMDSVFGKGIDFSQNQTVTIWLLHQISN